MKSMTLILKPVSSHCNLACRYCYHYDHPTDINSAVVMSLDTLEKIVRDFSLLPQESYQFLWHGGEPLLAGTEFFEHVVALQEKYFSSHQRVTNLVQTNGTLVDNAWINFFRKHGFRVGVSVDGPKHVHDTYRLDSSGTGTFVRVTDAISALKRAGVGVGVIAAITRASVLNASDLFSFFVDRGWYRFNVSPVADMDECSMLRPYSVTAREWGLFLISLFNLWLERDDSRIHIQLLDEILRACTGRKPGLCVLRRECGKFLSIDANGELYVCGRFLGNEHFRCGNIHTDSLVTIGDAPDYLSVVNRMTILDDTCESCEWKAICNGGCATYRFMQGDRVHHPYFCQSMKMFLPYIKERIASHGLTKSTIWKESK